MSTHSVVKLTLEQLRTPVSADDALADMLQDLQDLGFTADSWQEGSIVRTILESQAEMVSRMSQIVKTLVDLIYIDTAEGDNLSLLVKNLYDITSKDATPTVGYLQISDSANAGPYTFDANELVAQDDDATVTFSNTSAGTLSLAASASIEFRAESSGTLGNVDVGKINSFVVAPAGLAVSNPAYSGSTWITVFGQDAEPDAALRSRAPKRFTEVNGLTGEYYEYQALTIPGINQAKADTTNPRTTGSVDIYVWGEGSPPTSDQIADAQALLDKHKALDSDPLVRPASATVISVTGSIYVDKKFITDTANSLEPQVKAAVQDYFSSASMGGTILDDLRGYFILDELTQRIMDIDYVKKIAFINPVIDVQVNPYSVVQLGDYLMNFYLV